METVWPLIEQVAESTKKWFENKENVDRLTTVLNWIITTLWVVFKAVWTVIWVAVKFWETLWHLAFKIVTFVNSTKEKMEEMKETFSTVFTGIKELWLSIFQAMLDWVKAKFEGIISFATDAFAKVNAIWSKLWSIATSIKNSASSVWASVSNAVSWNRAYGWSVQAWKSYYVWERWKELFVPSVDGSIVPQVSSSASWWGMNINWPITVVTNDPEEFMKKLSRMAKMQNIWIT